MSNKEFEFKLIATHNGEEKSSEDVLEAFYAHQTNRTVGSLLAAMDDPLLHMLKHVGSAGEPEYTQSLGKAIETTLNRRSNEEFVKSMIHEFLTLFNVYLNDISNGTCKLERGSVISSWKYDGDHAVADCKFVVLSRDNGGFKSPIVKSAVVPKLSVIMSSASSLGDVLRDAFHDFYSRFGQYEEWDATVNTTLAELDRRLMVFSKPE